MLKPVLQPAEVTDFITDWAGRSIENLSQFQNGCVASVFSFDVVGDVPASADPLAGNGKYVIRFASLENAEGLKKDRFIGPRAAAVGIPVPRQVKFGETEMSVANLSEDEKRSNTGVKFPLAYAICDRAPGEHMGDLQDPDRRHLVPTSVTTIDTISLIDISDTSGFGWFDGKGNATHETWYDYIAAQAFPKGGNNFFERRREWFADGFLEADIFQRLSDRMMELVHSTDTIERSVVHMEFGYDNTLVEGNEVTAALDWDNSIIGDHVYDGAWNDLYFPELDIKNLFVERYRSTAREVPNLDQRWLCCQIHIGLQALQWYGVSNNPKAYEWMKARTLFLMGEGPAVGRHPGT